VRAGDAERLRATAAQVLAKETDPQVRAVATEVAPARR